MNVFKDDKARGAFADHNKAALYQGILDSCAGMRKKLDMLREGKLKYAVSYFKNPNNHKQNLRVTQYMEDGNLRTNFFMDDSKVWEYCAKKRKDFDEYRKHAATTGSEHMFREYFLSSWLLEAYVLMKYGIDLRNSDWLDPTMSDYKKVSWIIDNDSFAARYKLTTYWESRGMPNPFNEIKIEMRGLDLSHLTKDNNNEYKSSVTEPQTVTNTDRVNASN